MRNNFIGRVKNFAEVWAFCEQFCCPSEKQNVFSFFSRSRGNSCLTICMSRVYLYCSYLCWSVNFSAMPDFSTDKYRVFLLTWHVKKFKQLDKIVT